MKSASLPVPLAAQSELVRHTVARNLDRLLTEQRWSRRAAANALGLTHRYVNSRAAGEVDLSASDLSMFAKFLGVSEQSFFEPVRDDSVISIGGVRRGKVGPEGLEPPASSV